jgi:ParB-like chromosome segregation protein Spo0J
MTQALQQIPLTKLIVSDANVRRTGRMNGVGELAASIKAHGLLQNLTVRLLTFDNVIISHRLPERLGMSRKRIV